jgi:hypothetical protein
MNLKLIINKLKFKYIRRFPEDCRGCKHYHSYDMSVDDITHLCLSHNMQIDDCDTYWYRGGTLCPKNKLKKKR